MTCRGIRRRAWAFTLLAATGWSSTALAAEPTAADRQAARRLAGEAFDLARAGDVDRAIAKLREADRLVTAPTLELEIGKLLEKQDRLLEAAEAYRAAIAMEVPASAPRVHRQAREESVERLAAVLGQTPKLTVKAEGLSSNVTTDVTLTIDGEAAPLGEPLALDPGAHAIVLKLHHREASRQVELARGDEKTERLRLPDGTDTSPSEDALPPDASTGKAGGWAPLGWTLLAIGAGGLATWGIAGGIAMSRQSDLRARCDDGICPRELQNDVDAYDTAKVASTMGFAIGIAGAVLAIPPLVFALTEDDDGADQALYVGPSGLWWRGCF